MRADVITCPVCRGDGVIDSRRFSARTREILLEMGLPRVVVCPECDGARVVTAERYLALLAASRKLAPVPTGTNGYHV